MRLLPMERRDKRRDRDLAQDAENKCESHPWFGLDRPLAERAARIYKYSKVHCLGLVGALCAVNAATTARPVPGCLWRRERT